MKKADICNNTDECLEDLNSEQWSAMKSLSINFFRSSAA